MSATVTDRTTFSRPKGIAMMKLELGGEDEMSALRFIVEMTKALAWPLLMGGLAFTFRKELREIANRLKEFKFGSVSVLLAIERLTADVASLPEGSANSPSHDHLIPESRNANQAETSTPPAGKRPRPFVRRLLRFQYYFGPARPNVEAGWLSIEEAIVDACAFRDLGTTGSWNGLLVALRENDFIAEKTEQAVRDARKLYEDVRAGAIIDNAAGATYRNTAMTLAAQIGLDAGALIEHVG